MKKVWLSSFLFLFIGFIARSQDTLPHFDAKDMGGNHIVISWTNKYEVVKQISIQRSNDSLKNYKTILSVPDPMNLQNGFVDTKAPGGKIFYRLFIVLDKGMFLFTNAKRPVIDSMSLRKPDITKIEKIAPDSNNTFTPPPSNSLSGKNNPNLFVPSMHVYTYKDGNIRINLPDLDSKKFSIKFFEEDNTPVFEIKEIKETPVLLDKSNFYHAGWFKFELYEDGKLIEKNKIYLAKPF
jgi:hypothetical protein